MDEEAEERRRRKEEEAEERRRRKERRREKKKQKKKKVNIGSKWTVSHWAAHQTRSHPTQQMCSKVSVL
jgi:hypothetical protein